MNRVQKRIKRVGDLSMAWAGLVMAAPLILVAGALIRLGSPGSMFFTQWRAGLGGKPFRIYKLRSMLNLHDASGQLLPDEYRINAIGRFLRATSMDELPQLINIIKGEMSFIGPRPLPVSYLDHYAPEQRRRHDVLPGMGSYADIKLNRSVPDWDTVFACDVWYVDHWSLWLDIKLFFQIALLVLSRRGSEQGAAGKMPGFGPH